MENQKLLLFAAFAFVWILLWQAWADDYSTPNSPTANSASVVTTGETNRGIDLPSADQAPRNNQTTAYSSELPNQPKKPAASLSQKIRVTSDLYELEIDTMGGDVRSLKLRNYPIDLKQPEIPVELLFDRPDELYIAQSGLLSSETTLPNHHTLYSAEQSYYELANGQEKLEVVLSWKGENNVEVQKIFTVTRGQYLIDVNHRLINHSDSAVKVSQYRQLQRTEKSGSESAFIHTYLGGVIYSPEEKYEKYDFGDMAEQDLNRSFSGGWAAMIEHYFLSAWVPNAEETSRYYSKKLQANRYILGLASPETVVLAGDSASLSSRLVAGPKLQEFLENVAEGLELTVDYGFLTFLAKPVFWVLDMFHSLVNNWGWAIILVVILIKALFFKLSETSYKSMANMRKMQPRMKELRERHGDNKQALNQAMMDMYKKEKINPLSGCLPILAQMPVFISLYWVLLESVELRQADFIFWLSDLSQKDPYYVLPLLMGATMLIQQRLNPAPIDPMQAKVMMAMPIVFTVFFAFFPSGLVLYWVVNNGLSIAQQWVITRRIDAEG